MAYDDDMGHDEDQGIGNAPGGGGDEPQVDTFSEFSQPPGTTPGFDAGRGDFSVGSHKNGQTVKGGGGESTLKGQQSTDRLIDPQLPAIDSPIKSPTSSRPLQQTQKQVAAAGSRAWRV